MGGGDADCAAFDVGERVEAFDGLVDSFGPAGTTGGYDDERCAGEEDGGGGVKAYAAGSLGSVSGGQGMVRGESTASDQGDFVVEAEKGGDGWEVRHAEL